MHFFLLGANGRTGQHVVSLLLSKGHTAVALVRDQDSLAPRSGLTVTTGSPLAKDDIARAISASPGLTPAAAIVTLNAKRKTDSPFSPLASPPRFMADCCAKACAALEDAGIRRIVIMSSAGVGDSWGNLPWLSQAFMWWTNIRHCLKDHILVDEEIRRTKMDWTLVRAVRLEHDELERQDGNGGTNSNVEVLGGNGSGMRLMDSLKASSAASFLVSTAIEGHHVRSAVVIRD